MIQNIEIKNLSPHPHNPRTDLGDLTELAESIKTNGVMQNLTVVPWFSSITGVGADDPKVQETMGYTVVIGHRRLSAAKLAGLTELPCAIVEMDQRKQMATMLLENMQRSDLTTYEQAHGFQMMMDLGDTVNTIAQQTGFSETTIRKRVKLLELDKDKFKAAEQRGGTLADYARLNEIDGIAKQNEVLAFIGTRDFDWKITSALNEQKEKQNKPLVKKELDSFATMIPESNTKKYEYAGLIRFLDYDPGKLIPKDAGKIKYFYSWGGNYPALYKESTKKKSDKRPQEEIDREKAIKAREVALEDITRRAFEMRKSFVLSKQVMLKDAQLILEFMAKAILYATAHYAGFNEEEFRSAFGIEPLRHIPEIQNEYFKLCDSHPLRAAFICAWCSLGDKKETGFFYKNYGQKMPVYSKNLKLELIYEMLAKFGYEISSEEASLMDGSHQLLEKTEEPEEVEDADVEDEDDEEDEET